VPVALRLFGARLILDVHDTMPEWYRENSAAGSARSASALLRFEERRERGDGESRSGRP